MKLEGTHEEIIAARNQAAKGSTEWRLSGDGGKTWRTPGVSGGAASATAEATTKGSASGKMLGMKPTTAILGAVVVGGLAYGAIKMTKKDEPKGIWADKIEAERQRGQSGQFR